MAETLQSDLNSSRIYSEDLPLLPYSFITQIRGSGGEKKKVKNIQHSVYKKS